MSLRHSSARRALGALTLVTLLGAAGCAAPDQSQAGPATGQSDQAPPQGPSATVPQLDPRLAPEDILHIVPVSRGQQRALLHEGDAVTLTVTVDGATQEILTTASTLGEALAQAGIVLGWEDLVSADLTAPVPDGTVVRIERTTARYLTEQVVTPFPTEEWQTSELLQGETRVIQEGVDGDARVTSRVHVVDGVEVSRAVVMRAVGNAPVPQIVEVGTREPEPDPPALPVAGASGGASASRPAPVGSAVADTSGNRALGQQIMLEQGFAAEQWSCLEALWTKESNWNHLAANSRSTARGIPQAMMSVHFGASWQDPGNAAAQQYLTDPGTQIRWGLGYIANRYGTPCDAWGHFQAKGWY